MREIEGYPRRENSFDLLRIFAMFMVILNHVADKYLVETNYSSKACYIYEGLSHCAVPLFCLLTGAFVIDKVSSMNIRTFYLKSFKKFAPPTILFIIIYWINDIIYGEITSFENIIEHITAGFGGKYAHWYMIMLIGVYATIPFIAMIRRVLTSKQYTAFAVVFFIWSMLSMQRDSVSASWTVGCVFTYLGWVLLGDVIRHKIYRKNNSLAISLFVVGVLISSIFGYIQYIEVRDFSGTYYNKVIIGYCAPAMIVSNLLMFSSACLLDCKFHINSLVKYSLIIFLCHKLIIAWFGYLLDKVFHIIGNLIVAIPINVIIVFVLTLPFAILISSLLSLFKKKEYAR